MLPTGWKIYLEYHKIITISMIRALLGLIAAGKKFLSNHGHLLPTGWKLPVSSFTLTFLMQHLSFRPWLVREYDRSWKNLTSVVCFLSYECPSCQQNSMYIYISYICCLSCESSNFQNWIIESCIDHIYLTKLLSKLANDIKGFGHWREWMIN